MLHTLLQNEVKTFAEKTKHRMSVTYVAFLWVFRKRKTYEAHVMINMHIKKHVEGLLSLYSVVKTLLDSVNEYIMHMLFRIFAILAYLKRSKTCLVG